MQPSISVGLGSGSGSVPFGVSVTDVGRGTGLLGGVADGGATDEGDEVAITVSMGVGDGRGGGGLVSFIANIINKDTIATKAIAIPVGVDVRSIAVFPRF